MKKWQDIFEPEFKLGFGAQIGIKLKDREEFRKIIDFVGKSMFGDVVFVGNFRIPKTEIIDCLPLIYGTRKHLDFNLNTEPIWQINCHSEHR